MELQRATRLGMLNAQTKKNHLAVVFFRSKQITAWQVPKRQQLEQPLEPKRPLQELERKRPLQELEQLLQEQPLELEQPLLFYRKQPGQQQQ